MARNASSTPVVAPAPAKRPGALLPALSAADAERIRTETEAGVAALVESTLSANTRRSYRSALRYWDAWHWAAYGTGLPLFAEPRQTVTGETVRAFVAQHAAKVDADKRVVLAMPELVRARMEAIGAFGQRQVATRAQAPAGMDVAIPAVATVLQRVALLNGAHTLAKLPSPLDADPGLAGVLRGYKKASAHTAQAALRQPKKSITAEEMDRLLDDCAADGLVGRRDAALLRIGFTGRRRGELASMRLEHLEVFALAVPVGDQQDGWKWGVRVSKGRTATTADGIVDTVHIVGYAAQVLEDWIDQLRFLTGRKTGPVWPRLSFDSEGDLVIGPPMDEEDIAAVVKQRMEALGFKAKDYAGHSLRSGAARTAGSVGDAQTLLNHKSESTTRQFYADREAEKIAAAVRHDQRLRRK